MNMNAVKVLFAKVSPKEFFFVNNTGTQNNLKTYLNNQTFLNFYSSNRKFYRYPLTTEYLKKNMYGTGTVLSPSLSATIIVSSAAPSPVVMTPIAKVSVAGLAAPRVKRPPAAAAAAAVAVGPIIVAAATAALPTSPVLMEPHLVVTRKVLPRIMLVVVVITAIIKA